VIDAHNSNVTFTECSLSFKVGNQTQKTENEEVAKINLHSIVENLRASNQGGKSTKSR
jgi:hypothetical protein